MSVLQFCLLSIVCLVAQAIKPRQENNYRVHFDIDTPEGYGKFVIQVHSSWAPNGARRFKELVQSGFFDNSRFFRVIPDFMAQFGISGDPQENMKWMSQTIPDDRVTQSNKAGYVSFAASSAADSRTTQLFINYKDNERLDNMGFAPIGVVEGNGMDIVRKIYNCGEDPSQDLLQSKGNSYADEIMEGKLSKIIRAYVIKDSASLIVSAGGKASPEAPAGVPIVQGPPTS